MMQLVRAGRWAHLGALLAIWLAMLLLGAGEVDRNLILALYVAEYPGLALAAHAFTYLGYAYALIPLTFAAAAWMYWRGLGRAALLLIAATLTGRLLVVLEKLWFGRLRPAEDMRLVEVSSLSFPSAHSANSMMVFLGIAMLGFDGNHRRIAVGAAILLSLLIGLSRPMLGVHWPSDVVGGWAFGAFWMLLCIRFAGRNLARRDMTGA